MNITYKKHLGRHTYRPVKGEDGRMEKWKSFEDETSIIGTIVSSKICIKCGETNRNLYVVSEARNV